VKWSGDKEYEGYKRGGGIVVEHVVGGLLYKLFGCCYNKHCHKLRHLSSSCTYKWTFTFVQTVERYTEEKWKNKSSFFFSCLMFWKVEHVIWIDVCADRELTLFIPKSWKCLSMNQWNVIINLSCYQTKNIVPSTKRCMDNVKTLFIV